MHISRLFLAGTIAGIVNGLFGTGGGMVLVPLLSNCAELEEDAVFPSSVCIIFPVCIVALLLSEKTTSLDWKTILIYLTASAAGGLLAGRFGKKIPACWLHRILGAFILWGGIRYLC